MIHQEAGRKVQKDETGENKASADTELDLKESITEFWMSRKERMIPAPNHEQSG